MAKTSGNDLVVKSLKDEGVDTVFYLTGGPMVDVASRCIEIGFRSVDVCTNKPRQWPRIRIAVYLGSLVCVLPRQVLVQPT